MSATINLHPLTQLFDKRQLVTDAVELITYEVDAGFDRGKPDGVFYPRSAAEVSQIMRWAGEHSVPLIARGAGTGLSGGAVPEHGGIIIEFARMNQVLDFDAVGRSAVIQPGAINQVVDGLVKNAGLYYPPDPSSGRSSTIGGNLGENAGGPHCFKYGVTTNYVTGLEIVLADGRVLRLGGRALDYPEYDFTGLIVGSEGTLAIITEVDVRLIRNPPGVKTMMVSFTSVEQAGQAVSAVIAAGLMPATLEMMDQKIMRMIEDYAAPGLPVDAEAGLIVEVDGYPASLDSQMEETADILTQHGGYDLRIARSEEDRAKIWYGRKSAAGAVARLAPSFYLVDVTVPRSRLGDTLAAVDEICRRHDLRTGHVFHAGDGNLHPLILCDARDPALMKRVFQACDEIVALCLERGGSITGEHGVGIEKRKYMPAMYTAAELSAMLDIKTLFDPQKLLNPGKIFPDERAMPLRALPHLPNGPIFTPASADEAAGGLAALSQEGKRVRIGGASVGDAAGADVWLSTSKLRGLIEYAPNDLYVTVGAGTPVTELQTFLAERNMQAPFATPWPNATVGGLVAANINSPLRMRYGALRDLLLATTVAMADGRVIRAGRDVVKNVAGYDLPKVFVGSQGTLGLLVDLTFKLTPRPRAQQTLALPVADLAQGMALATALMPHLLVASGLVLVQEVGAPAQLLLTVEGVPEDVAAELEAVQEVLATAYAPQPTETNTTATARWAEFVGQTNANTLLVRAGVPTKALSAYLATVVSTASQPTRWLCDVASGLVYIASEPENSQAAQSLLATLREPALAAGGYAVVLNRPDHLQSALDPWGYQPESLDLMRGLKAHWDPAGILVGDLFADDVNAMQ